MNDFLTEIEYAGLMSRIKRLSDEVLYSTRDYYKTVGLDIEPNWHLIFLLLEKHKCMTITEIAQELRMSHPACVKIIKKMKKKGYINTSTDDNDSRKQLLELSEKSKEQLPVFREHWNAGAKTTEDLIKNSPHFVEELKEMEILVSEKNYKERTLSHLNLK
ncbi:MarR family transcriptional regulator [Zobellia galactanivorans]|uniref:MarR-type transcriptional regulator n=1 Tax=Zobellia galactanivorans (strain DSM 12802 / CCUG 47099 / CIP 106680 / NCIMB 13871 / Dsij) TaxID=63186 RepID=G0L334_ZOBGA|nr:MULTISPECIES: MarR family transcriptional regulator [Zobellia]MBU3024949.1 MarR family transcriptional regulator [Zobellia galactanivorans]MDO6808753.1 MarR family transcriptional regulator [Zobellia galactanivorans]OWW25728.1 MarR family transcriptional regulator [Zobellia sp. OII3]CAZ98359.1 MarR-type transcriptional regulator [Zobellia galactanivorans]